MKRGLLFLFIALFAAVSLTGVRALSSANEDTPRATKKYAQNFHAAASVNSRAYRSPGGLHKITIAADETTAIEDAKRMGAVEIADYGSFKLFALQQSALDAFEAGSESQTLPEEGVKSMRLPSTGEGRESLSNRAKSAQIRDDFNVLLLRSGVIDTSGEANDSGIGREPETDSANRPSASAANRNETFKGSRLRLIQFAGPVKRAWLDQLRGAGLELISYVPNNAYLVRQPADSSSRLDDSIRAARNLGEAFIQWQGDFKPEYKIHPALLTAMSEGDEVTVAVQFARSLDNSETQDVLAVQKLASSMLGDSYTVLNFTNLKIRVAAGRIAEIAALPNVVNIETWSPPRLFDERASQIIAGQLLGDGKEPRGPGYMAWLQAHGFTSPFGFAIDISDTGIDRGSILAASLHPDFKDAGGQSRIVYARDYSSELDPSDVQGHGTINLSIAGGYNLSAETRDATGYNSGLGIAPFAKLGSSKIFQSTGRFDLNEPFTNLISAAYRDGARISSNSWGDSTNSYTIDAQEYDTRVRDAVPSQAGNQEMLICFAAGNGGTQRVGAPSSAKNVLSVGASENVRKGGADGCGLKDEDADNVQDIAIFSARGPLDDGRMKPDIVAPGTHISGAASQNPDFDSTGVCGSSDEADQYFPAGQKLYTWSSGTSHSTPIVAGAAALVRQFLLNRGEEPNAALIKALLVNTTSYLTGARAGGDLPQAGQGWGLINLGRLFDSTPTVLVNQTQTFSESGQEYVVTGEVKDASQPFRVTLGWTDAPGFSAFAPWVNDLDLEVVINGQVYRGNNFQGDKSKSGGETDTKNNVESVWFPAGTVGAFAVRVRATNVAGDGLPGNNDSTDQDFALVVYNGERRELGVATLEGATVAGGADAFADPGETVSLRLSLKDLAPTALNGASGVLSTVESGVIVTTATSVFANIAPGASGENLTPFIFMIPQSTACGTVLQFTLELNTQGVVSKIPFTLSVGKAQPLELFSDDIEAGETKWTHASALKKKKKKIPIDPWMVTTKRAHSGGKSWFAATSGQSSDAHLDSVPITLSADAKNLRLIFYHTFEFEGGGFDGSVLEISTGGDFEDLGSKILVGGYTGTIIKQPTNALSDRDGWINGRLGAFQQVVVDLSSFAGKTVTIRFRVATDNFVKTPGWYIDDVILKGDRVSCAPVSLAQ
jgi:hypothetical protein